MEKFLKENIDNRFLFKSSKKIKKFKKVDPIKNIFDININSSNYSIKSYSKNKGAKSDYLSLNSQNILFKYSGFSPKNNGKIILCEINSNKSIANQSNIIIPSVKSTPQFKQGKKIEFVPESPNEKNKTKKSSKHHHKKNIDSLHKQIKSDYKKVLKKNIEKPIKINIVSLKFRIADDFNEINSKTFLYEKDKCLKKMHLTDKIKEEENTDFIMTLSPKKHHGEINPF